MSLVKYCDTNNIPQSVDVTDGSVHTLLTDASGVAVKQVDNKLRVSSMPYLYDIAEGNVANHTKWEKIGYASVPVTTECDVWSAAGVGSANYTVPLIATQATMRILSNNAADVGTAIRGDATTDTVTSDASTSLTVLTDADVDFLAGGTVPAVGDCVILDPHGTVPEWGYITSIGLHTLTCANGFSKLGMTGLRKYAVIDYSPTAGCHAVYVSYLDNTYTPRKEIIVTNSGANGVLTINANYFRINSLRVIAIGSAGKPTGTVAVMDNATPPTIIYSYISAGYTRARNSIYTVPAGKTLYITEWHLSFGANATNKNDYGRYYIRAAQYTSEDGTVQMRTNVTDGVVIWYNYAEVVTGNSTAPVHFDCPIRIREKTSLKISGVASGAGIVTSGLRGWLE